MDTIDIIVGAVLIVFLFIFAYIIDRKAQIAWQKKIAKFVLYYCFKELLVFMNELMVIAPKSDNSQSTLAGVYLHTTISLLMKERYIALKDTDNIFVTMEGCPLLCQLFYTHYKGVVAGIRVDGISNKPLEYSDFMDKVHEVRMVLRKITAQHINLSKQKIYDKDLNNHN